MINMPYYDAWLHGVGKGTCACVGVGGSVGTSAMQEKGGNG